MIKVFYGDDRVRAKQEIAKFLGDDYEIVDAGELTGEDLPTLFKGNSLFAEKRKILVRDFLANRAVCDELEKYLDTAHDVVIFEMKLDKRSVAYKAIKDKVEIREFAEKKQDFGKVFDIYRIAKRDGVRAVAELEKIEQNEEPMMFVGVLVSQALKDYAARQGVREKKILKELAKTDMLMKTGNVGEPWLVVKAFLMRMSGM